MSIVTIAMELEAEEQRLLAELVRVRAARVALGKVGAEEQPKATTRRTASKPAAKRTGKPTKKPGSARLSSKGKAAISKAAKERWAAYRLAHGGKK